MCDTRLAYSLDAAAQAISVSRATIERLVAERGDLPPVLKSFRLGGRRLIHHADLAAFVDRLAEPAPSKPLRRRTPSGPPKLVSGTPSAGGVPRRCAGPTRGSAP